MRRLPESSGLRRISWVPVSTLPFHDGDPEGLRVFVTGDPTPFEFADEDLDELLDAFDCCSNLLWVPCFHNGNDQQTLH